MEGGDGEIGSREERAFARVLGLAFWVQDFRAEFTLCDSGFLDLEFLFRRSANSLTRRSAFRPVSRSPVHSAPRLLCLIRRLIRFFQLLFYLSLHVFHRFLSVVRRLLRLVLGICLTFRPRKTWNRRLLRMIAVSFAKLLGFSTLYEIFRSMFRALIGGY